MSLASCWHVMASFKMTTGPNDSVQLSGTGLRDDSLQLISFICDQLIDAKPANPREFVILSLLKVRMHNSFLDALPETSPSLPRRCQLWARFCNHTKSLCGPFYRFTFV